MRVLPSITAVLRRRAVTFSAVGAVALSALLAACGEAPVAPQPVQPPSAGLVSNVVGGVTGTVDGTLGLFTVNALTRTTPVPKNVTRSWRIKRTAGGTLHWPEMGLTVTVPAYAFAERELNFTVTALAGRVVAYDFGPDGAQFTVPLLVSQSLHGTSAEYSLLATLRGAYFRSAADIDQAAGTARVAEFQSTVVDLLARRVQFEVTHFSGYMVSMD